MKKLIVTITVLMTILFNANASINNIYQHGSFNPSNAIDKTQAITNDAISLNSAIDDLSTSDPRIKSVIEYVKANGYGVSIIFFNKENLRYVKQVNELFTANDIFTDPPELAKSKNLVNFNLIEIYVIKEKHNVNKSTKPIK